MNSVQGTDDVRAAFEDVYERCWHPMVRLAGLTTGSVAIAEEIVQDAFVQLYRNWSTVQVPAAWLRVAVVNGCRGWLRRQYRERRHRDPVTAPMLVLPEEAIVVRNALDKVSARQRTAVVLRFYEDLSEAEIAEILHCRPGTVKSLLSRAKNTLRKELHP